jgi:hypothetical protein
MGSTDKDALAAEWSRANAGGRVYARKKLIASFASVAVTGVAVVVGYVVLLTYWPFDRVPILFLSLPWIPALPLGLVVRQRLWPRGALGT